MNFRIAIIGAGLIGRKRASALREFDDCSLKVVVDIAPAAAQALACESGARSETDWKKVVSRDDIDIVVVSTINNVLRDISIEALGQHKHVLCEKPLGRNVQESLSMVGAARDAGVVLKTGFNHRHHPAIFKAKQMLDQGVIGDVMFLRCRYGHGGRPGYEKEWRASQDLCGGGELLDQGVHVVDLFRWFAGDFGEVMAYTPTCCWDIRVEDNAFAMFRGRGGIVATMHASWTQWKNLFSFEIFGKKGYLIVEGLGGSYGPETLRIGRRKPEGGVPDEESLRFDGPDISWKEEWREFLSAIAQRRQPLGSGEDGHQANRMIESIYRSAKEGQVVSL